MFTLKVVQGGITNIRSAKHVTIAYNSTDLFKEAIGYAKKEGLEKPDYIEHVPELMDEYENIIQDEIILDNGERKVHDSEKPIAVVVESADSRMFPSIEAADNTAFTFIYKGDEVYVMNQNGSTIEAVR